MNGPIEWIHEWIQWMDSMNGWTQWLDSMIGFNEWTQWEESMMGHNEWIHWIQWNGFNGRTLWGLYEWIQRLDSLNGFSGWTQWGGQWMDTMTGITGRIQWMDSMRRGHVDFILVFVLIYAHGNRKWWFDICFCIISWVWRNLGGTVGHGSPVPLWDSAGSFFTTIRTLYRNVIREIVPTPI